MGRAQEPYIPTTTLRTLSRPPTRPDAVATSHDSIGLSELPTSGYQALRSLQMPYHNGRR